MAKTIEQIQSDYNAGVYTTKLPPVANVPYQEDETQSIAWNRQKKQEHEVALKQARVERMNDINRLEKQLQDDLIHALIETYKFNEKQAQIIFYYVWQEKHSNVNDVFGTLYEVADMVENVMKAGA